MKKDCLCGCGMPEGMCEEMDENQQLMGMPALGPTDGEPCQDCDDDNFALDEFGGAAIPARREPPPSDFDDDDQHVWKIHELRRYVRAVLLASR
jgi:hypothetical protein